jgi:cell division protein FtsB
MSLSQFKLLPILLIAILLILQYRLWFETGGIQDMVHLKKELSQQQHENETLKKRNDTLLQEVQYLQKNKDAIEGRARQELGMIKKDETFYQVVK